MRSDIYSNGRHLLWSLLFGFAAYVNLNDSDALIWTLVYAIPFLLSVIQLLFFTLEGFGPYFMLLMLQGVYIVWMTIRWYTLDVRSAGGFSISTEEGRELGGLVLLYIWLFVSLREHILRKTSSRTSSQRKLHFVIALSVVTLSAIFFILHSIFGFI